MTRSPAAEVRWTIVINAGRAFESPVEVVVINNGSTDGTREVVSKYGDRVEYIYKENGGQASAFNVGIEKARGEFVALLDADDYWLPGKVRRVVEEFGNDESLALIYHPVRELIEAHLRRKPKR